MSSTPAWLSLVVALLGIAGVLTAQWMANKREQARTRDDAEREQRRWAREDAARSYEQRRDAYMAFVTEYHRRWKLLASVEADSRGQKPEPSEDFFEPLEDRLVHLTIFGTSEATALAKTILEELMVNNS